MSESQIAEKPFACSCGHASTTKSGLTNHQKFCASAKSEASQGVVIDAVPVNTAPPAAPGEPRSPFAEVAEKLGTSDRHQFKACILERRDAMLEALDAEIGGNASMIQDRLRADMGLTLTVVQINELIQGVDQTIEAETEQHLKDKEEEIKSAQADLDEEIREKEEEMRDRHRQEYNELHRAKKEKKQALAKNLKDAKETVLRDKVPHLTQQKLDLQAKLILTRQKEKELQFTIQQRHTLLKRSRERLTHVIRDAANRALEKLLVVGSRREAGALIESIPTIGEAIHMCNTPDGFAQLFKRLDSTMQLPAPPDLESQLKVARAEAEAELLVAKKTEDEESDDADFSSHENVVYADEDDENGNERRRIVRDRNR